MERATPPTMPAAEVIDFYYFPELKISATAADAEPIVDSLSTVFSEIKPVN